MSIATGLQATVSVEVGGREITFGAQAAEAPRRPSATR
jgi:hypothetical protein